MKTLMDMRKRIDEVDARIMRLLEVRFKVVKDIGKEKRLLGLPVRNAKRESEILAKVRECEHPAQMANIFKKIMSESRRLE